MHSEFFATQAKRKAPNQDATCGIMLIHRVIAQDQFGNRACVLRFDVVCALQILDCARKVAACAHRCAEFASYFGVFWIVAEGVE